MKSLGFQQTVGAAAATGLAALGPSAAIPTGADVAYVQCETNNVRWRDDGTNPTASVGMLLLVGSILVLTKGQWNSFKLIEVAASATINVTFYKTN